MEPGEGKKVRQKPEHEWIYTPQQGVQVLVHEQHEALKHFSQGGVLDLIMIYKEHSKELIDNLLIICCCLTSTHIQQL